ncbi:hypothetical protein BDV93DRAFT_482105 [Ceratobasidium sp. AG-I]|nr:hypothetical protein BDV93DRAFT_482105 [Ceratobasidium sp. AG-I]
MATMDKSFTAGVVLMASIWDDHTVNMLWLDIDYLVGVDLSDPGVSDVTFSNNRVSDISSTFSGTSSASTSVGGITTAITSSATSTKRTTSTLVHLCLVFGSGVCQWLGSRLTYWASWRTHVFNLSNRSLYHPRYFFAGATFSTDSVKMSALP